MSVMMLQTDGPADNEQLEALVEAHTAKQRLAQISSWAAAGHVSIQNDIHRNALVLRIDAETIYWPREEPPTAELIARIALALAAGLSDTNRRVSGSEAYMAAGQRHDWMEDIDYRITNSLRRNKKVIA